MFRKRANSVTCPSAEVRFADDDSPKTIAFPSSAETSGEPHEALASLSEQGVRLSFDFLKPVYFLPGPRANPNSRGENEKSRRTSSDCCCCADCSYFPIQHFCNGNSTERRLVAPRRWDTANAALSAFRRHPTDAAISPHGRDTADAALSPHGRNPANAALSAFRWHSTDAALSTLKARKICPGEMWGVVSPATMIGCTSIGGTW